MIDMLNFPNTRFMIVGSNPTSAVKELARIKNVEVTGFVEDIRPYYKKAGICAIPFRIARGVQNKVLEAIIDFINDPSLSIKIM